MDYICSGDDQENLSAKVSAAMKDETGGAVGALATAHGSGEIKEVHVRVECSKGHANVFLVKVRTGDQGPELAE